ncbi:MAG: NADPH:quinone oxidoreductase family protein [Hyphomicrobiales bacterium]|nr:NADPH:quinone oxidoreductase family protein [Hyphomicrobiales bacterium]
MKAALCKQFGGPDLIAVEDIAEPEPGPGEVVIEVRAAALNFYDTLMIRDKYQLKPPMPFSPAGEVAGTVAALGPGVTDVAAGDRVMAYIKWNGCRERTLAKAADLVRIPDGVGDEAAAGLTVTYGTAIHGLKDRGRLRPGETVAVLGASGGAGLAAIEIAKAMGARVVAAASSPEKLAVCEAHGADLLLDYKADDLKTQLKALTDGKGADIVYDCVGGAYSEPALRSTAWEGRFLVIGFASGEIPKMPLNLALLKGLDIVGVFWNAFADREPQKSAANMAQVLDWCASGTLKPHIHGSYPLAETAAALTLLDTRQATGKVLVCP